MKVSLCAGLSAVVVASVAGLAGAEVNWETRVRFTVNGVPATSLAVADGPVEIVVQAGIFNVTGLEPNQANHGLSMWSGRISSTVAGLGVNPGTSRMGAFNFGPAHAFGGFVTGGGTGIDGSSTPGTAVYAARPIAPTENYAWGMGQPEPTGPLDYGVESYTDVFRFTFTMSAAVAGSVTIQANGTGGPILRWIPFSVVPPTAGEPDGTVNFIGTSPTPILRDYAAPTLELVRVPAPAAAGLVLLAPLARRRRR